MVGPGERFWAVDLDEEQLAVLERGQGQLSFTPNLLVVGGGIMGVLTASRVSKPVWGRCS